MVETLIIKCLIGRSTIDPFTLGISWITALVIAISVGWIEITIVIVKMDTKPICELFLILYVK